MSEAVMEVKLPESHWWGIMNYQSALDRMVAAHADRVAGKIGDQFFYLEHEPVITFGRATPPEDLQKIPHSIPTREVSRGGLATYHGPGQLVCYLVLNLADRVGDQKPDIHAYLRALEFGLSSFLKVQFNLNAGTREGFTGVWTIPAAGEQVGRKLASIGVSARKWVTSHGFALNIHPDMTGFNSIVPCGITDAKMTSVSLELERQGRKLNVKLMEQWAGLVHKHVKAALNEAGWAS